jgi:hypothetical protein
LCCRGARGRVLDKFGEGVDLLQTSVNKDEEGMGGDERTLLCTSDSAVTAATERETRPASACRRSVSARWRDTRGRSSFM